MLRIFVYAGLLLSVSHCQTSAIAAPPQAMSVDLPSGRLVGLPIHWGSLDAAILQSNGRIQVMDAQDILGHEILPEVFQPQSLQQARIELQAELGERFETLVSGPYVIAAPRGQVDRWDARFKSLFAGYLRFFQSRGWQIMKPDFPLVVIVLHNQQEFLTWASREVQEGRLGDNLAGMYVPRSNRCLLYQVSTAGRATDWRATEETIAHEAIHQLAYNTGIHERLFQHPLWFVEGLATVFEVPSVYELNLQSNNVRTKIHSDKLRIIQGSRLSPEEFAQHFQQLVQGDHLFRTRAPLAYALSWALTFTLIERMPKEYYDYVMRQRQRGFQQYEAGDRELDFRQSFGASPEQLSRHVLQLLNEQ
jgi:hypothetical protein